MYAKKFVSDKNESVWNNNGGIISVAVETNRESMDLTTGWLNSEKHVFFIKGKDEESLLKQQEQVINALNNGKLATIRVFSKTPFHSKDKPDINPEKGEVLDRYSQVRLCPASEYSKLNRTFVETAVEAVEEEVEMNA